MPSDVSYAFDLWVFVSGCTRGSQGGPDPGPIIKVGRHQDLELDNLVYSCTFLAQGLSIVAQHQKVKYNSA